MTDVNYLQHWSSPEEFLVLSIPDSSFKCQLENGYSVVSKLLGDTKLLSVGKHLVDTKHLASMKMCFEFLIYSVSLFYKCANFRI